jgi:murein DD-endopeptidase MepM/ murein hydrolase activator NlpD
MHLTSKLKKTVEKSGKNRVRRGCQLASLCFALGLSAAGSQGSASRASAFEWQPHTLTNGSPVLFEIKTPAKLRAVTARWMGHNITFFKSAADKDWYGLGGIPLTTAAGSYDLRVAETFTNGRSTELVRKIRIGAASYPKIMVKVSKQYTEPSPEQLTAISADKSVKANILSAVSAQRLWTGTFVAPVSVPVSDIFGTARVFNDQVQSRHQGLDFAAPPGTNVHAINSGVVILARPMFFEGNCVVIDHGQGLLSLYLHLSAFKVKEGEQVRSGDLIALSGGTGRATGPHLHLAIRWQGIYINPAILLKIKLPSD